MHAWNGHVFIEGKRASIYLGVERIDAAAGEIPVGYHRGDVLSVSRNTTYNLVGAIVPVVLSLATVPLYLKMVGPERYGVLAIAWLLLGYFGLFDLGIGRSTSFRIASLRDAPGAARADTFWAALSVNLGMGLVGGVLLLAAAGYFFGHVFKVDAALRPEIMSAVPLLACAVPIATLTGVLTGAMQGRERFLETNIVSLISTTLFQLFPLAVAYWIGPNISTLLAAAIAARLAAILVLAQRCYLEFCKGHPRRIKRAEISLLLRYGGWVNLTSLFGPLLVMIDRFAIGAVLGAVAVTIYTVPFQLAQRIQILPGALTNALFPRLSASKAEEQKELASAASRTLVALMSLPVLGAIFIVEPFLRLWVGDEVGLQSGPIGRIVLIGFWVNSFALISFIRLQASGRPDLVTKALLAQIPFYTFALYFALKYFGFVGCAIVFSIRCVADYIILTWLAEKSIYSWRILLFSFSVLVLGAYFAHLWSIADWRWWVAAISLGLVLLVSGWRTLPPEILDRVMATGPGRMVGRVLASAKGRE